MPHQSPPRRQRRLLVLAAAWLVGLAAGQAITEEKLAESCPAELAKCKKKEACAAQLRVALTERPPEKPLKELSKLVECFRNSAEADRYNAAKSVRRRAARTGRETVDAEH